ncbi:MAG TPA: endonuclease/exonuclease/phosphatase family protein [Ferruginibacter sp.]|nr:endonuclease/exonuclease/phosphatase family protein [Ferruginibacter sp.]HMP19982.1 endonuclease/exonuclease/phosphatase family protein [Ferruginibacter sp.]
MSKSFFRRFSKKIFILANLLTALLYVTGCYGRYFFAERYWPVGLLWLAAFYLLGVLFLFFIFWLFVKPGWSLISVVAVVSTAMPLRQVIPYRISAPVFVKEKNAANIRVMSWNVSQFDILINKQKPEIRDRMLELINAYSPDIACFQEMVAADTLININTPFYKRYSFYSIYDFSEKLSFPYYHYSYNFKENFFDNQHFGIIIFSKYPIVRKVKITYFPYDYNSSFQYADIAIGADTVRVFNVHLQSLEFTPENLAYIEHPTIESKTDIKKTKGVVVKVKAAMLRRQLQANRIRRAMEQSPYPVILCGDFNDVPNSYAYHHIGRDMQNAFVEKGAGLGRTFAGIAPTLRIDNIFVDKQYSIHQFVRIPKKLSDHYPIIADISRRAE